MSIVFSKSAKKSYSVVVIYISTIFQFTNPFQPEGRVSGTKSARAVFNFQEIPSYLSNP